MKIVLRADVDNLGKKGDLVDVADGYARNYLVPRASRCRATPGIQKQADAMRRNRDAQDRREREAAEALAGQLRGPDRRRSRPAPGEGGRCSDRSPRPTSPTRSRSRPGSRSTAARSPSTSR